METQSRGPPARTRSGPSSPSCASARGRLASITTSARRTRACRIRTPDWPCQSSATDRLRPFSRSKNSGGPRRAPSGRCVDSTFTTVAPARARRSPQSGPAQSADRSTTTQAGSVGPGRRIAQWRSHHARPDHPDSPTWATGSPSSWARPRRCAGSPSTQARGHRGPRGGARARSGVELQPRRNRLHVLGPRQRHGHEAAGARKQPAAPPAARRAAAPQPHQRRALAQQRQRVQIPGRNGRADRSPPPGRRVARAARRGARSVPWHPLSAQRATRGSSIQRQGNVSRSSTSLSAEALLAELHSAIAPERSGAVLVALHDTVPPPDEVPGTGWAACPSSSSALPGARSTRRWLRTLRRDGAGRRPLARRHRWSTSRRIPSRPPRSPSCYAARAAVPWTTAWWPSRPPIRFCSPGPSSTPGAPAHPADACDTDEHRASGSSATGAPCSITLTRADRLNALDARMRDELVEALAVARGRHRHQAGRAPRRGQGLLRRRGPQRVRHPARSGHGSPHPAATQRRAHPGPPRQADDDLRPRRLRGLRVSSWPPSPTTVVAAEDTRIALPESASASCRAQAGRSASRTASAGCARHGSPSPAAPSTRPRRWSGAWSMSLALRRVKARRRRSLSHRDSSRNAVDRRTVPSIAATIRSSPARWATCSRPRSCGSSARYGETVSTSTSRGQVLGPVVDEDGSAAAHGKVRRQVAAVGVTTLLREVAADKVVHAELLGPGPGVVGPAGAPQEDPRVRPARCSRISRAPGRSDVPRERVDQTAVDVEDPAASVGRRHPSGGSAQAGGGGRHYWYTLFPMKHPWDRRLGFWFLAEEYPDQPAVVACPSGVTLSFSELAGRAHRLVHGLRAQGLGAGDIFAYALPNDVDMLCWQLAAQEGGFQSIALNPALSGAEIQRIVDHSEAAALILHSDFADRVDQMSGTGSIGLRISVGGDIEGFLAEESLVEGQPTTAASGPPAGPAHRLLLGHDRAAESRRPATHERDRPIGRRRCLQELRPCLPVPAAHRAHTSCRPACTTAAARASTWAR